MRAKAIEKPPIVVSSKQERRLWAGKEGSRVVEINAWLSKSFLIFKWIIDVHFEAHKKTERDSFKKVMLCAERAFKSLNSFLLFSLQFFSFHLKQSVRFLVTHWSFLFARPFFCVWFVSQFLSRYQVLWCWFFFVNIIVPLTTWKVETKLKDCTTILH